MEENDSNEEGDKKKVAWGIILSFAGIVVEVISMICTIAFGRSYDETGSSLPASSFILMGVALCGQLFGCCVSAKLSKGASEAAKCDENLGILCFVVIGILSLPGLGLFQFVSGILMAIVTGENAAANVQAFGGFIAAMNFISAILAVVYAVNVYMPACLTLRDN